MERLDKKDIEDIMALTSMQEGMLFHYLKDPESNLYFEQLSLNLTGQIDITLFEKAWNLVIETNEMLRTLFRWENLKEPVQMVLKKYNLKVEYYNFSDEDKEKKIELLEELKIKDRKKNFDLFDVPFRVILCKIGKDEYELIISNHHILYDGWSNGIILNEFFNAYSDLSQEKIPIKRVKSKYKEFVKFIQQQDKRKQEHYWVKYLKGFEARAELSMKKREENQEQLFSECQIKLNKDIKKKVDGFIKENKLTLASVLYSAWGLLIKKYCDNEDIIFGTTVSGRPAKIKGAENVVGLFINTLPLRVKTFPDEEILDFLNGVNNQIQEREEYINTPLIDIKGYSGLGNKDELFNTIMVIENYPLDESLTEVNGKLAINSYSMFEFTHYDITVSIRIYNDVEILFTYNKELFDTKSMLKLSNHFKYLLLDILDNPVKRIDRVDILSKEEKEKILIHFNDAASDYSEYKTIHGLFADQVAKRPNSTAVMFKDMVITLQELDNKSNQLAGYLKNKGVNSDTIVGIMVERSLEMVVGILGIVKAGGAFLPIESRYPLKRIRFIVEDSGTKLLLTKRQEICGLDFDGEIIDLNETDSYSEDLRDFKMINRPEDLVYVIYTSGSTGTPKGTLVEQKSVLNLLHNMEELYPLGEEGVYLLKTNYSFDVSITEIFGWIPGKGKLGILEVDKEGDPEAIACAVWQYKITHINFVPSMLRQFLDAIDESTKKNLIGLKYVFVAGESFSKVLAQGVKNLKITAGFENLYGPTEAAVYSTAYSLESSGKIDLIPIGKPLKNIKIYIVDKSLNLQPIMVAGELCIGNISVARGYLNSSELSMERFVNNSFSKGDKLYRTGDLARWLPDGNIEFLGRIDYQVKIRGFRVEPGEIEWLLQKHYKIKEAIVIEREDKNGDKILCAYIVSEKYFEVSELREYLLVNLPEYMVPSYFVRLKEIPLAPNGKINRNALSVPEFKGVRDEYVAPGDELEKELVEIWSEVLGVEKEIIGIDTNFFELGGHSLKIIKLVTKINKEFDIKVPFSRVFSNPKIREIALLIKGASKDIHTTIEPVEKKDYYLLSSTQRRLFFLQQMEIDSTVYNIPIVISIDGELKKERLNEAFRKLIDKHESLRTSFKLIDGEPIQKIHPEVDFKIENYETGNLSSKTIDVSQQSLNLLIKDSIKPFNLFNPPLFRVGLIKLGEATHILIVDMHHIVSDGASIDILVQDVISLYRGEKSSKPRILYKDYSEWRRNQGKIKTIEQQEAYWQEQLEGEIPILNLPVDYSRPAVKSFEGSTRNFEINKEETHALKKMFLEEGVTLYIGLLAIFNVFLSKICNQDDIVIGSPVVGRRHSDLESIIGMFVNTLPLRNYPTEDKSFRKFLKEVYYRTISAFENQDYQFEDMVEHVTVRRDLSRNPLFDVMLVMQNMEVRKLEIPGLKLEPYQYENRTSKFDMTLNVEEIGNRLVFTVEYSTKLFKEQTIERFIKYFKRIVISVLKNPGKEISEIELMSKEEKKQVLFDFNNLYTEYPKDKTICDLFEEQVEKTPDRIALVFEDKWLSYCDVNEKADILAETIKELLQ